MPLINLNGSSGSDTIAEPRIDQLIARDSEVSAAINAHVAAADPHTQYLNQSRADVRYRLASATIPESAIDQLIARDSEVTAAINSHLATADPHTTYLDATRGDARYSRLGSASYNSGDFLNTTSNLMLNSSPATAAAFLTLHRPGLFWCNVGVGTDNQLRIGGLSYGNNTYIILNEANHGASGDPHPQYLNQTRADARYRNSWETRWNPGNNIGSGAAWQFHHDFQTAKITCSKSLSVPTANTWVSLYSPATFSLGRTDTFSGAYWITEYRPSNKIIFIPALLSGAYQVIRLNPQSGQISSPVAGSLSFDFSIFVPLDIFVE